MSEAVSKLEFKRLGSGFEARHGRVVLGMVDRDVDGFFYWFPAKGPEGGSWSAWVLRQIVERIEELNIPWQHEIDRMHEREP